MFMEASAMTGDGVEDIFLKCARSILTKVETGKTICLLINYLAARPQ
jgi:hypothetical protein